MAMDGWTARDDRATEAAAQRRIAEWNGLADQYDAYRPAAPVALPPLLTQLAGTPRPALVVDLGCGTGLSTLLWADVARQVIGVEPNADMRTQAEQRLARARLDDGRLRFVATTAEQTGLPDGCADIVTASQAFHWMEPTATMAEVARILRQGGVFAAYDYDWPPTITWQAETLFHSFMDRVWRIAEAHGFNAEPPGWEKAGHLERMRASGHFRQVKEVTLHNVEQGDAGRFIGVTLSNVVTRMLGLGELTAEQLDLAAFEQAARKALPATPMAWYVSYRVRLGLK